MKRAHPSIDVEVSTSTAPVELARDGVDAAIRTAPLRPLQPVAIAPFVAPALAASLRGGLDQMQGAPRLGGKTRARDGAIWHRHAGLPGAPAPLLFESTTLAIQAARNAEAA